MSSTSTYLALHGLFPHRRLGAPFFWIGTLGVGLGVMLLILVVSVMEGFGATYRQKIVELGGDLRIESQFGTIERPDLLLESLGQSSEIAAAAPYAQGFMMVEHAHRPAFPIVRGIDPKLEGQVIPYEKSEFIKQGSLDALDDEGIMLSSLLAKQIGARLGSKIDVYTPLMISKLGRDELFLPRELKVVGLYETGWHDFDANTVVMSLPTFQELYGLGDEVHGITLRLKKGSGLENAKQNIQSRLSAPLSVSSWKENFRDFLWVLDLERNMMFFLMLFVIVVAAFAMGAAQLMTVLRKTREIGLIMAMGATTGEVASVYALQGFVVGLFGVGLGNVMALIILAFRNPILHRIAEWTGTAETFTRFYQFYELPMSYSWGLALVIAFSALILSTLSGLIPAFFVGRLKPAEALRNE